MNLVVLAEESPLLAVLRERFAELRHLAPSAVLATAAAEGQAPLLNDGEGLGHENLLVVFLESAVPGTLGRSGLQGLEALEEILSDPRHDPGKVLALSFTEPDVLPGVEHQRLPVSLQELEDLFDTSANAHDWTWDLTRLRASVKRLRPVSAGYRHRHKNVLAALRILLGALQSGVIDPDNDHRVALDALTKLRTLANLGDGETPEAMLKRLQNLRHWVKKLDGLTETTADESDIRQGLEILDRHRQPARMLKGRPEDFRILALDDQWHEAGWQDVLPKALRAKITGVTSWKAAEDKLDRKSFDLMLLDCNLGPDVSRGLELLPVLRAKAPDLPVIMMTAYDYAELAVWALRAGCNGFFAKELADAEDRDPLDYFIKLLEVTKRPEWESRKWQTDTGIRTWPSLRELWNRFSAKQSPAAPGLSDLERAIRLAFYLLFNRADGWEHLFPTRAFGGSFRIDRIVTLALGNALVALHGKDWLDRPQNGRVKGAYNSAKHGGNNSEKRGPSDAFILLEAAIPELVLAQTGSTPTGRPSLPKGCPIPAESLRQDDLRAALDARDGAGRTLHHLERSIRGACQHVKGKLLERLESNPGNLTLQDLIAQDVSPDKAGLFLKCAAEMLPPGTKSQGLVLIEDGYGENHWDQVASMLLCSNIRPFESAKEFFDSGAIESAKVVLLDLHLPAEDGSGTSPDAGLKALERIREEAPWLPVLVFSAATDSSHAIRALRRGAFDFLPKWLPDSIPDAELKKLSRQFQERVGQALSVSKSYLGKMWKGWIEVEGQWSKVKDALSASLQRDWEKKRQIHKGQVGKEIWQGFLVSLLPALVLFQRYELDRLTYNCAPVLDRWRVDRVLEVPSVSGPATAGKEILTLACSAVEYLARVKYCVDEDGYVNDTVWKAQYVDNGAKKFDMSVHMWNAGAQYGEKLWKHRNEKLYGGASLSCSEDCVRLAFLAWSEFLNSLFTRRYEITARKLGLNGYRFRLVTQDEACRNRLKEACQGAGSGQISPRLYINRWKEIFLVQCQDDAEVLVNVQGALKAEAKKILKLKFKRR